MRRNFVFQSLPFQVSVIMAEHLVVQYSSIDTVIIKEGDDGDYFYVLESGGVQIIRNIEGNDTLLYSPVPGDSFGEMALLYNCPRNATIVTTSDSKLWAVDRVTFRAVVSKIQIAKESVHLRNMESTVDWHFYSSSLFQTCFNVLVTYLLYF